MNRPNLQLPLHIQDLIYEYTIEPTEEYVRYYGKDAKFWKYFDTNLENVLYYACLFNYSNFIHYLLGKLNTNQYDLNKCLMFAANGAHMNLIRFFINKGATGTTAWNSGILGAQEGGHLHLVEFFKLKLDN